MRLLARLSSGDPNGEQHIVRLLDYFYYKVAHAKLPALRPALEPTHEPTLKLSCLARLPVVHHRNGG
eukprot:6112374-Pleurochrysis_carterae.AAC.1